MIQSLVVGVIAYICGSIPFAKIIGLHYGIDIQKRGSGNIGFANVLRVLGWKAAIPVLILDVTKGFLPTFLAYNLFGATTAYFIGFLAVIGHLAPIWLKFHGGKGVSTSLGVLLAVTPIVGLVGFLVYVLASIIVKKSSLASLVAGFAVLTTGVLLYPALWWAYTALLLSATFKLRNNFMKRIPNYDTV